MNLEELIQHFHKYIDKVESITENNLKPAPEIELKNETKLIRSKIEENGINKDDHLSYLENKITEVQDIQKSIVTICKHCCSKLSNDNKCVTPSCCNYNSPDTVTC